MPKGRAHIGRTTAWLCVLAVAIVSLLPEVDSLRTGLGGHTEHAIAYAITAFIVSAAYRNFTPLQVLAALTTCALCFEYLQRFLPGRNARLSDLAFSTIGIAIGVAAFAIYRKLARAVDGRAG